MQFSHFDIPGPIEIIPRRHGDARGYFAETFRENKFAAAAGPARFVQENQSLSAAIGTIRGLHFQSQPMAQGKLVRCIAGALFDVAVDIRHDSPHFGQWLGIELSADNGKQLWIPAGFAHGFCTLAPDSVISYKVTEYYSPEHDAGIAWDDATIAVAWPALADAATLSPKDRAQPALRDLPALFAMADGVN